MRTKWLLLPLMAFCFAGCHPEEDKSLRIDGQNFPDDVFRSYLTENFDLDGNGVLDEDEILAVDSINVPNHFSNPMSGVIYTLDMIDRFENLRYLDCYGHQIKKLDLSQNEALVYLNCGNNPLASLNVSGCLSLRNLYCGSSNLKELDLSKNAALVHLEITGDIGSLDLKECELLESLYCVCPVTSLDVRSCTVLKHMSVASDELTSLDVSGCTALESLGCSVNQLTSLDVSGCTALTHLSCDRNQLTNLDVSGLTALRYLYCYDNQLTSLDVSGCTALYGLECNDNQLTSIDVSKNTALGYLQCSGNEYHVTAMLNMFDLNQLPEGFDISKASNWNGGTVEGTALTFTQPEVTYTYNTGYAGEDDWYKTVTFTLVCDNYDESLK